MKLESIPTCGLIGALLIVLKLMGLISLSWWGVLCPFWFGWPVCALGFLHIELGASITPWKD